MKQKTEWQIIDTPGNPYCMRDTDYAHLRIFKRGDGFCAEVHAGSNERIELNQDGMWGSHYFYADMNKGVAEDSPDTVWVTDKEIRSIEEMKSFLEQYVSNWDANTIKERAEDYNKRRSKWFKEQTERNN
jgi:hypothetical protein